MIHLNTNAYFSNKMSVELSIKQRKQLESYMTFYYAFKK